MQLQDARPPYIRFEKRAVEKRDFAGNVGYIDVDFAVVTSHGSKDNVEKVVDEWLPMLKEEIRQGRFPQNWYDAYLGSYRAWKNDQEPPLDGTAITNWPSASPAEIKILTALGIRAVEDLAQANEELKSKIGMGAISLVQRARDFVAARADHAPLVARLDAMQAELNGLKMQVQQKDSTIGMLERQLAASKNYVGAAAAGGFAPRQEDFESRVAAAQVDTGPSDNRLIDEAIDSTLA